MPRSSSTGGRSSSSSAAAFRGWPFLDMGDQFLAISEGRTQPRDDARHFGLVVDDLEVAREALAEAGAELLGGRGLDFRDPWGNHVQVVDYRRIQFTKSAGLRRAWASTSQRPRRRSRSFARRGSASRMDLELLERRLAERGEPYRAAQVWEWAARGAGAYAEMSNLPLALRAELDRTVPFSSLAVERTARSRDGTEKALFATADGARWRRC